MRPVIAVVLCWTLAAVAQQVGQNAPPESNGTTTISVSTQLVVEAVAVNDKKGNPIEGLTAKDFTVTENGVVQAIRFCEHQALTANANLPLPQLTTPAGELVPETMDEECEVEEPEKTGEAASRLEDSEKPELATIRDALNRVGTATWDEISQELGSHFEDSREPSQQASDNIPRIGNQKSK